MGIKSKPKTNLSSKAKRDLSKNLSDSFDRTLPKEKKKIVNSESSDDSENEMPSKQKFQSKSKPHAASESENDTILTKSLTSSKLHKSDSPKKHRKNASKMPTKESKDIDKILSESDEYISSKKQKDSKKLDNDKKISITSSDDG